MQGKEYIPLQISSTNCCLSNEAILATYGHTAKDFLACVNPSAQTKLCNDEERCYFEPYPSLGKLNEVYGKNTAKAWLIPELVDLSEYCGVNRKITANQLSQCADIIANDYHYLKVSEMLLFFGKFKRCCYGRFYGTVDPLVIIEALKEFCRERNVAYYNKELSESKRQLAESVEGSCSWEDYAKIIGEAGKPMPTMQPQGKDADTKCCKPQRARKTDVVYEIATALVNNTYRCDENTLQYMIDMFRKKYGHSPEVYIGFK